MTVSIKVAYTPAILHPLTYGAEKRLPEIRWTVWRYAELEHLVGLKLSVGNMPTVYRLSAT